MSCSTGVDEGQGAVFIDVHHILVQNKLACLGLTQQCLGLYSSDIQIIKKLDLRACSKALNQWLWGQQENKNGRNMHNKLKHLNSPVNPFEKYCQNSYKLEKYNSTISAFETVG